MFWLTSIGFFGRRLEVPARIRRSKSHFPIITQGEIQMAKGQQRGNREAKKPKKQKPKVIAAAPPYADASIKAFERPPGGKR